MRPVLLLCVWQLGCSGGAESPDAPVVVPGIDGGSFAAGPVVIELPGSHQNPCWSPGSDRLVFTRFVTYNVGPSALAVVAASGGQATVLVAGDQDNVGLPGCWNAAANRIVYSSDEVDRDEVWHMRPDGSDRLRVTDRPGAVAYEPSMSPDGNWIVFESRPEGVSGQGSIWKVQTNGTGLDQLTDGTYDDRQPNWSPAGDRILFQSSRSGNVDIWTMATDGTDLRNVTQSAAEDTDASWSPDGSMIVYSSDENVVRAEIFVIDAAGGATPVQATSLGAYAGAPAWSPDGAWIAFETYPGDPDGSPGTTLAIVAAP